MAIPTLSRRRRAVRWLRPPLCAALTGLPATARAIDLVDTLPATGDVDVTRAGAHAHHNHWVDTGERPFVAGTYDLGLAYVRPTLAIGYGEPHHEWFGIGTTVDLSPSGVTGIVDLRGALHYLDARLGLRYEVPIDQHFLEPREQYTPDDVETDRGGRAHYLALDAELSGRAPFPGGWIFAVAAAHGILGTPAGQYVFEEALNVVIEPPLVWRGRAGYLARIGLGDQLAGDMLLGGAFEVIHNPGRDIWVTRAGPLVSIPLTCHLEAIGAVMLIVSSPDRLGLTGAGFGQLGLRYRWASGDPAPGFP